MQMYPNEIIGSRLKEERLRLGLSQTQFADLGGVQKQAQLRYEKGERAPGADYLAAVASAGADVLYILVGRRDTAMLSPDEAMVLAGYRSLDASGRSGVLGMMGGMITQSASSNEREHKVKQNFKGATVGQQIKGDITAPFSINMGSAKRHKKKTNDDV